jgi:DNA invertase Pin-like site-specific DNA recombinase
LEKTSLLERQAEGILQAKLKGVYKGRQEGTLDTPEQTLAKHKRVVKAIRTYPNLSLRQIAKLSSEVDYKVSPNTVRKVKELMSNQNMQVA